MKSFDEWHEEYKGWMHPEADDMAKKAWDHKQAEVDGLQMKLSEDLRVLHNVIDIERKKCEELQKRIDEALHEADESCGVSVDAFVKLNKILKGNTNDH